MKSIHYLSLFLTSVLASPTRAQDRTPSPLPPSYDVKTAREPSFPTGTAPARPALDPAAVVRSPKDNGPHEARGALQVVDRGVMHYATSNDGSLWARGAQYKIGFDAAGAIYLPAFGRNAPHDLPHGLSPDRVSVGGASIEFERAASARRDGDRVSIDRGAFVEGYELRPESVEQTFVFSSLPRTGDLLVHIPVASELEGFTTAEGLEFRGGLGRVTYGRATAIDGAGRRATAATELEGGAITIRVDAGFLATATMPLTIDPLVSTFNIDASAGDDYWADTAYDAANHVWLVVYEEWFSSTDRDALYGYLNDAGPVITGIYLDLSSNSWDSLHVANNAAAQQFCVVSSVTSGLQHYILASTIYANGTLGTQTVVVGTEYGAIRDCVIGGDPYTGGQGASYYCVVFERMFSSTDWDILVRLVRTDGSLVGTMPIFFSNSGGTIDVGPAVSKSDGAHDWMIAWQRNNGYAGDADVWGGILHWDGTIFQAPFQISAWFQPEWQVAVSSPLNSSMRYLVTWQDTDGGDHDIIMALLDSGTKLDQQDLSIQEQHDYLLDQVDSSVDSDGDHFLVAYSEQFGGADYDIYASDVYVTGNSLGLAQRHMAMDVSTSGDYTPRVCGAFMAGAPHDPALKHRFLVAWNSTPPGGGPADVRGGFIDTVPGGSSTGYCYGDGSGVACPCGNNGAPGHGCANSVNAAGALLTSTGYPSTATDSFVLHVSGMPPTALCTFLQGINPGPVWTLFGDGLRCAGAPLIRLGSKSASGGMASFPGPSDPSISVRGAIPAGGDQRVYQVWYRNPTPNFCTQWTYNISNGVLVNWAL